MQLWACPYLLALFYLTDVIIYCFLCAITLCELICLDSASYPRNPAPRFLMCERKLVLIHVLLELNLLQTARQALHNKLRVVDSCTTKDTWGGVKVGGEEGELLSFPFQGGTKIYVLSGSCNKTKRVRRCRLGTNMKGSGVWRQSNGAPPEDWMKLSLYNQRASAWLPLPLPSDRWGLPLQMGFSQCYQPTSRVKQCFSFLLYHHFKSFVSTQHPTEDGIVSRQAGSMFISLRDHVT